MGTEPVSADGEGSNVFGLVRQVRAQSVELAILLSQVKREQWHKVDKGFPSARAEACESVKTVNPSALPILTGIIAVIRRDPVPWSYATLLDTESMPCEYVVLNVDSPGEIALDTSIRSELLATCGPRAYGIGRSLIALSVLLTLLLNESRILSGLF